MCLGGHKQCGTRQDESLNRLNVLRSPEEGEKTTEGRGMAKKENNNRTERRD